MGWIKNWFLLGVAFDGTGLALDPGEVAARVETDGQIFLRCAESHSHDVVGGAKGKAQIGRE